ncbi:MAG: hypothetical protein AAF533_09575 [Acidobacteriota bacterium]
MTETDWKLITAVLPSDVDVHALLERLRTEKGLTAANLDHGRGVGRFARAGGRRVGETSEKEILTALVEASKADDVFAFLFDAADMNRPHGGLLYVQPIRRATRYELPDVPVEG